jgi:hypothetical protein
VSPEELEVDKRIIEAADERSKANENRAVGNEEGTVLRIT